MCIRDREDIMGSSLARVINPTSLRDAIEVFFKTNHKTEAKVAKAVFSNGIMKTKTITKEGSQIFTTYVLPQGVSTAKSILARDLAKNGVKGIDIASLLQVSPVSYTHLIVVATYNTQL